MAQGKWSVLHFGTDHFCDAQKLRHKSKKSVFRNSETKYFTNLLTNHSKYVRIPLRNKMFHKPFAMKKIMRGYYEKER